MKKVVILVAVIISLSSLHSVAQTFTGSTGTILDDGSHNYYPLTVSGVVPATMDANYGLETVCINLTHTWDDDIVISLIAPDGSEFLLAGRLGGDGDNYTNTCFNYSAAQYLYEVGAPFTGTYKPQGTMSVVNNGQNANGLWRLHILDTYPFADTGDLLGWSLTFGNNPATPFPFNSTQLPLVLIQTSGGLIPDEPKIMANMKIIRNPNGAANYTTDFPNIYNGKIGIEQRGNSSGGMPKKSYNFETRNADSSSLDVSLLDMPAENDWTLIANYSDKTLLRNYYSYRLFRKMGHWAPRMEFCEVLIDGEYQGIYLLGERIKKDVNRVDIASNNIADTAGAELTGGYIFKVDWIDGGDVTWQSEFPAVNNTNTLTYILDYPKPENVQPQQLDYIKAYVDSFELAMSSPDFSDTITGFRKYISQQSFIDYIILDEFTKNVDGYRLSTFFYKEKNGKIKAGPPWDYDLSWGNADYMDGWYPGGWDYETQEIYTDQCPFFWSRFFEDTLFMNRLRCRWEELRQTAFNPDTIKSEIDSLAEILGGATDRNFTKWPILGVYVWPNPSPIPADYPGEIDKLKDWTGFRITWLDEHWTGTCDIVTAVAENGDENKAGVYPNPTDNILNFREKNVTEIMVCNLTGQAVLKNKVNNNERKVYLENLASGNYIIQLISEDRIVRYKFVKQ